MVSKLILLNNLKELPSQLCCNIKNFIAVKSIFFSVYYFLYHIKFLDNNCARREMIETDTGSMTG